MRMKVLQIASAEILPRSCHIHNKPATTTTCLQAKRSIFSGFDNMNTSQTVSLPAPMTNHPRRYERPIQVHLCYQATCNGDLDGVKEQVRRLLHGHKAAPPGQEPRPEWLFSSLCEAISRKDIGIVQFLLEEKVAGEDLPGDLAVRSQAFEILELFLRCGWDINKPLGRNQPSVLGYCF